MNKWKAMVKVAEARGYGDYYTRLIAHEACKLETTNKEITRLMFDILLGIEKVEIKK